jgi:hypothetical protein
MTAADANNGGALDLLSRLRSFSWDWSNNHLADDGYLAGGTQWNGGTIRDRCEIGNRMESGVLELVLDAERSGERILLKDRTPFEFVIDDDGVIRYKTNDDDDEPRTLKWLILNKQEVADDFATHADRVVDDVFLASN